MKNLNLLIVDCNKCGFVHDFYEGDENCDKQPGCEIANGVSVA